MATTQTITFYWIGDPTDKVIRVESKKLENKYFLYPNREALSGNAGLLKVYTSEGEKLPFIRLTKKCQDLTLEISWGEWLINLAPETRKRVAFFDKDYSVTAFDQYHRSFSVTIYMGSDGVPHLQMSRGRESGT